MKRVSIIVFLILIAFAIAIPFSGILNRSVDDLPGSAALDNFPLIDGHNDFAYNLFEILDNKIESFDLNRNLSDDVLFGREICSSCFTDIPRLKKGKIGAQFWAAYVSCKTQYNNAVTRTLDQIDVIKRFVKKYSNDFQFVTSADGILEAFENKKIGSLIGVEGGHSIDFRFSMLRLFYELGVRYLTLTHNCNTPWADANTVDNSTTYGSVLNLTEFGKKIVLEMNRLGMMIDLAHVSHNVMVDAIATSRAPVIFSHSSARTVYAHARNVDDNVLQQLVENQGIIMVNFYSGFVAAQNASIQDVANHINHIVNVTGVDYVGLGADYDGVSQVPTGLEDVSKYPNLFDLLKNENSTRWTIPNLEKLAGRNLVRVFRAVEKVRDDLKDELPYEDLIPDEDLESVKAEVLACSPEDI